MKNLAQKVEKLETDVNNHGNDISNIHNKLGYIESDMDDLKEAIKENTKTGVKTNDRLTDIHLLFMSSNGGIKVIIWMIGSFGTIWGIIQLIDRLVK